MQSRMPIRNKIRIFFWMGIFISALIVAPAQTPAPTSKPATHSASNQNQASSAPSLTGNGKSFVQKAEEYLQKPTPENLRQATILYEAAARSFRENSEFEAEAITWHRISQLALKTGNRTQAKAASEKARMVLRARTLPLIALSNLASAQAARAYLTLGRIQLESGEVREAFKSYQNGLYLAGNANLPREAAAANVALGLLAAQAEEYDLAIQLTFSSLEKWREAKDFAGEAMSLNNLARFYEKTGDLKHATECDEQAININRFSRNVSAENLSLHEALRLYLSMKNYEAAALACEQLIGLSRFSGDPQKESENLLALALIESQRDNVPSAFQLLLKAFIVGHQSGNEISTQVKNYVSKIEAQPSRDQQPSERERLIAQAMSESNRGDYSAAYQLLLRALVTSEGTTNIMSAAINSQIKALARQIESRQNKTQ